MIEKYNVTDKTTEEDLLKIFFKELVDRKVKAVQNKINEQSHKEYNYLKSVMSTKHK